MKMATEFNSEEAINTYAEGIIAEEISLRHINIQEMGDVNGKKIVDLGCGNGKYSIVFAEKGATVISIDSSKEQIELAKKINPHKNITYSVSNGENISSVSDNSIDIVFMNLVVPSL